MFGKTVSASAKMHPVIKDLLRTDSGKQALLRYVNNNKHSGTRTLKMSDIYSLRALLNA